MIIGNRKYRKLLESETIEANDMYIRNTEPSCVHSEQVGLIIPRNSDYDYYRPLEFKFERKLATDEILVATDEYRRIKNDGSVFIEPVAPFLIGKPASAGIYGAQSAYYRSTDADCIVIKGKKYRRLERLETIKDHDMFITGVKFESVEPLLAGQTVEGLFGYIFRPDSITGLIRYNGRNYWRLASTDILRDGDRLITADRNIALHPALIGCRAGANRRYYRANYVARVKNAFFRKIKTDKPMVNIAAIKKTGEQQNLRSAIAERVQSIEDKVQIVHNNLLTDTDRATAATDIIILSEEILSLIGELDG